MTQVMIEVKNEKEAQAMLAGLDDPAVRALVLIVGTLAKLPSDRARRRALWFVADKLDEQAAR
jgi:hypothetical protein